MRVNIVLLKRTLVSHKSASKTSMWYHPGNELKEIIVGQVFVYSNVRTFDKKMLGSSRV